MATVFPGDDVLGPVTWDEECCWWRFEGGPIGGRAVRGRIIPEADGALPGEGWLRLIRACVAWFRANEPQLRRRVAADMLGYWLQTYYDEGEDEMETAEAFAAAIAPAAVNFAEGCPARVYYDDAGLFGGHQIWVKIDPEGLFVGGPDFA